MCVTFNFSFLFQVEEGSKKILPKALIIIIPEKDVEEDRRPMASFSRGWEPVFVQPPGEDLDARVSLQWVVPTIAE